MEISKEEQELLTKISQVEATMDEDHKALGWGWMDVGVYPAMIHKLLVKGLAKCTYKSRSTTNYMLTDTAKDILAGVRVGNQELPASATPQVNLAEMFADIVGYEDIKELLRESLQLDRPIHVLLFGPPSLAKSMFLWDIERAFGPQTLPLIGSATSHAGMWDLIAERQPKIVLIDELEKMSLQDTAGLLSLMEKGRIIRTKVGRKIDVQLTCWVIGTANRIGKLPAELLSRFARFQLAEYNSSEYTKVVESVLVRHEDLPQDDAHEVAIRLISKTHDVRDAVRVARLSRRVGVKRAVELLVKE